ncbi:MAG: hypothetical protein ACPHJ3_15275, partial [Rubripirellula sp.]
MSHGNMKAVLEMSRFIGWHPHSDLPLLLLVLAFVTKPSSAQAGQFEETIQPLIAEHCLHCHEGADANGEMDFAV